MCVQPMLIVVGIVATVTIILLVACILICKKLVGNSAVRVRLELQLGFRDSSRPRQERVCVAHSRWPPHQYYALLTQKKPEDTREDSVTRKIVAQLKEHLDVELCERLCTRIHDFSQR